MRVAPRALSPTLSEGVRHTLANVGSLLQATEARLLHAQAIQRGSRSWMPVAWCSPVSCHPWRCVVSLAACADHGRQRGECFLVRIQLWTHLDPHIAGRSTTPTDLTEARTTACECKERST